MNSFWQRPPLSSEMENSHEIYKGGNCSFAAGSSGSVDQGAGRKASMNTDGITLIPKVFRLYYLENRGSAFGLMQNQKVFLVFFTVIILAALTFFYRKIPDTGRMMPLKIAVVLIYAGAIGNFIDRIRQSYVVDFFYFELIDFPVFNVADIYVTTAAIA